MSEAGALRRENEELRSRLAQAEAALEASGARVTPTLLRTAQERLLESQELFRSVFDGSLEALLLADDGGRYVDANPAACKLLGRERDQLIGRTLGEFAAPEPDAESTERVSEPPGWTQGQFPFRGADGARRVLQYSSVASVTSGLHLSSLRDVTARVASEKALLVSRRQLEDAQAIAHVGSWVSGLGVDDEVRSTAECCRILGLPVGSVFTVAHFFETAHPDHRAALRRAYADAAESGLPLDIEYRAERQDGRLCWVRARVSVERHLGGGRMFGTLQDVTDRRAASDALRESANMLRAVFDNTSDSLVVLTNDWFFLDVNPATCDLFGRPRAELVGHLGSDHYVDFDIHTARQRLFTLGQHSGRITIRRPSGELRITEYTAKANIVPGVHVALFRDVTERTAADERRRQLAAIVECSDDAILGADADGVITSWNHSAEVLLQWSPAEAIGQNAAILVPPDLRDDLEGVLGQVRRGEVIRNLETRLTRKDGSFVETMITSSPIFDSQGKVLGSASIVRDLTGARAAAARLAVAEGQLRQAQKMEAIGVLAGGVAHDFNNVLSVILSFTYLILGDLKPDDPTRADVQEIARAANRATDLTRQLLAFSRKQVLQPQVLDLGELLRAMEGMLRRLLGEAIEVTLLVPPALGSVLADPGQVEQVVMNLAVNARDAMPGGGKITFETSNAECDADYAETHQAVVPGRYVMLAITDTGHGMDAATRARIFEPFFTTKEVGRGTGLGLSTVFGIVKQSQGYIWVYSEPGFGTTFKIYLPRVDQPARALTVAPPPPETLRGSETVLLVEDEEQVRAITRTVLQRHGYKVLDAQNGGEALLVSEQFSSEIHLLLTDVVMPRMTGKQLAERLRPTRPEMKVLYLSGYTEDAIVHHGVLDAGIDFLAKPITPSALLRKVREVLDARRLEEPHAGHD